MAVGWLVWWYCVQGDAEVVVEQTVDGLTEPWPLSTLQRVCDLQEEVSIRVFRAAEQSNFRNLGGWLV